MVSAPRQRRCTTRHGQKDKQLNRQVTQHLLPLGEGYRTTETYTEFIWRAAQSSTTPNIAQLQLADLLQRLCPPCSQPCTHPSRSCGVEPTLCCCLVTFLADPALPCRARGKNSPWRSRTYPKTQWEDSAQLQMKSTNEMFLSTHTKIL